MELDLTIDNTMTKAQLCGLISKYLVYYKEPKPYDKFQRKEEDFINQLKVIARDHGIDPLQDASALLDALSRVFTQ
jgi:hypothetical protein